MTMGIVVFLPLNRQTPEALNRWDQQLISKGWQALKVYEDWQLPKMADISEPVALAAIHANELNKFSTERDIASLDRPLRKSLTARFPLFGSLPRRRRLLTGTIGVLQLISKQAFVVFFSGGVIELRDRLKSELGEMGVLDEADFCFFEHSDSDDSRFSDTFRWEDFLKTGPLGALRLQTIGSDRCPLRTIFEHLLALDLGLQEYLTRYSSEPEWQELRESLQMAVPETPHRELASFLQPATDQDPQPFSASADGFLERSGAGVLPTIVKERFGRCLLSAQSAAASQAWHTALSAADPATAGSPADGGAMRLCWDLAQGKTHVATADAAQVRLATAAHQELRASYQATSGVVPHEWRIAAGGG